MRFGGLKRLAVAAVAVTLGVVGPSAVVLADPAEKEPGGASAEHRADGDHADKGNPHDEADETTANDLTQPQPPSNADLSGNGANTGGAYDSTRDGSASGNGNGGGAATGKPCAGCVGKADNKNPPGQASNGGDSNNGYECDGNKGVARTNPAHTGCVGAAVLPETPVVPVVPVVPDIPEDVLGVTFTRTSGSAVLGNVVGAGSLARTGVSPSLFPLLFGGLLSILAGFVITRLAVAGFGSFRRAG